MPSREPHQGWEVEELVPGWLTYKHAQASTGTPASIQFRLGLLDADFSGLTTSTALDDASEIPASGARCFWGSRSTQASYCTAAHSLHDEHDEHDELAQLTTWQASASTRLPIFLAP